MRHKPVLVEAPKNLTRLVGENATFTVQILSDLHPHIEWMKGGRYSNGQNFSLDHGLVKVQVHILVYGFLTNLTFHVF
jgi:hypothetical protein